MMTAEMNAAIKEYAMRGWVVHPLSKPTDKGDSPGKKPILKGWQHLTVTPIDINKYVEGGCNLGLVCGRASGVDAIDLDSDTFSDELLWGVELKTLISGHRKGRGHILFQHEDDMFSDKHHFIGIEYFGNNAEGAGGNLVLPPSIHYSGEVYKWKDANAPLMKMPEKLKENIRSLFRREDELHGYFKKCRPCFTTGNRKYDKSDPRSKGLWERPDTIPIHDKSGRDAILAIMGELKAHGCPDDLLLMCCKRFFGKDYNADTTKKELQYVEAIHPKCDTLKQCLNIDCEGCTWQPHTEVGASTNTNTTTTTIPEMDVKEIFAVKRVEYDRRLEVSLPSDHFISEYVQWMGSITDGYKEYQIVCALWTLSALVGRKAILRLKQETIRPNLWFCILGRSTTSRKSVTVNKSKTMYEIATESTLFNDDYSIEGYVEKLAETPISHFVRDEAAGLIAKMHKKYNEGIFEVECAIYDRQNYKKTLAGGKNKQPRTFEIKDPYVTKLYGTTPENFSRYMTLDDFLCGYGYRFLYTLPKYKRARMPLALETDEDIEAWGRILARIKALHQYYRMRNEDELTFNVTAEAMQYFDDVMRDLEENADASENDMLSSVIGRAQGHILKIAMLLELGKKEMSTTIEYETMKVAAGMVINYFIPTIMEVMERLQEDIKFNQIEKVVCVLRRLGGVAAHTRVLHDCKMKSKDFNECITTMVESRAIDVVKDIHTKTTYYRLLDSVAYPTNIQPPTSLTNLQNPKNPPNPQIPKICSNRGILETSKNIEKLKDKSLNNTIDDACRFVSLRDSEMLGISGILEICGICGSPIINNAETVGLGLGKIHPECKFNPIRIKFRNDIPAFTGIDDKNYGSFKCGDVADIPAMNAYPLINRHNAELIKPYIHKRKHKTDTFILTSRNQNQEVI